MDVTNRFFGGTFSVVGILMELCGRDPETLKAEAVSPVGNKLEIDIKGDGNYVLISPEILQAASDPALRSALKIATKPVSKPGIDAMGLIVGKEQVRIGKNDLPSFDGVDPDEEETQTESFEVLEIKTVVFSEGAKWRFSDGDVEFWAAIEDADFWDKLHRRVYEFAEGDQLRVKMLTKRFRVPKLRAERIILEVIEPIKAPRQIEFPDL
jgi:hypothetical protein